MSLDLEDPATLGSSEMILLLGPPRLDNSCARSHDDAIPRCVVGSERAWLWANFAS
jgi:hypothetical protein